MVSSNQERNAYASAYRWPASSVPKMLNNNTAVIEPLPCAMLVLSYICIPLAPSVPKMLNNNTAVIGPLSSAMLIVLTYYIPNFFYTASNGVGSQVLTTLVTTLSLCCNVDPEVLSFICQGTSIHV